MCYVTNKT